MAENVLDRILAGVRGRLAAIPPVQGLEELAGEAAEARRGRGRRSLAAALGGAAPAVIAECKHSSPSAGVLREPFDPVALAGAYDAAGAAAISVVTEPDHFGGDPAWIAAVRAAVDLPVLRKDFVVTRRQLLESSVLGADAVLLIARILAPERLAELLALAGELELEVLLEIFADEEPGPAVDSGARIIGVNARDLATFAVDLDRVAALAGRIPADRVRVAESGIRSRHDLTRLHAAGYGAFLIGEHLVRAPNPGVALAELLPDT